MTMDEQQKPILPDDWTEEWSFEQSGPNAQCHYVACSPNSIILYLRLADVAILSKKIDIIFMRSKVYKCNFMPFKHLIINPFPNKTLTETMCELTNWKAKI